MTHEAGGKHPLGQPAQPTGLLLIRPTAAAVRCTFDLFTSMWSDRKTGGNAGSDGGASDGLSSDSSLSLDLYFDRIMPACLDLFGQGISSITTGAFSEESKLCEM